LVITSDDGTERSIELGGANLRIGRGAGNDIVLPDARKGVSRAHAELRFEEGRLVIVDLQSQNGTWVNGQRVQRAEVPPDAEIAVGMYRLRRKDGPPPATAVRPMPAAAAKPARAKPNGSDSDVSPWPEVVIDRPVAETVELEERSPTVKRSSRFLVTVVVIAVAALVAVALWQSGLVPGSRPGSPGSGVTGAAPSATTPSGAPPPAAPASAPTGAPVPAPPTIVSEQPIIPEGAKTAAPDPPARAPARRTTAPNRAALPPVPRKPNESVDAWRNRIAALEARFVYSKAALDRGDFGSAASGFEAILREEPGYPDAPTLLVQARSGLRAGAVDVVAAGNRLDAAGDWFGALQQYERAREVDPTTPGIDAAVRRVRDKLRGAGQEALERGREHEKAGRLAAALQEYEKAAQWLPIDDPNYKVAVTRADDLRSSARD
jgi:hypothetical protein